MAFDIQLAQPADAPKLAEAFFAAFCDPFNRTMFPDKPETRAWMEKNMLGGEGLSEDQIMLKVTDPSNPDVVAGFAKWVRPSSASANHDRQAEFAAWPESSDGELCDLFFGTMDGAHKEIMKERPHYCMFLSLYSHPCLSLKVNARLDPLSTSRVPNSLFIAYFMHRRLLFITDADRSRHTGCSSILPRTRGGLPAIKMGSCARR